MHQIIQIKQDKTQEKDSQACTFYMSHDGGLTMEEIGTGTLGIDWDTLQDLGPEDPPPAPVEMSIGYFVTGEGTVFYSPRTLGKMIGIVNHPAVADPIPTRTLDVLIVDDCSDMIAKCINALKSSHNDYICEIGGGLMPGKGKAAHKRKRRKMFGGW